MDFVIPIRLMLLIIAVVLNLVLGFLVFWSGPKAATNKIFGLLSLVISTWLIVNYISLDPFFLSQSLFWIRLSIFFAVPMLLLFFFLACTLPHEDFLINKKVFIVSVGFAILTMSVALSPFAFVSVETSGGIPEPKVGIGLAVFGLFAFLFPTLTVRVLIKRLKSATYLEKHQLLFVTWGILLMLSLIFFTIFLPVVFFGVSLFLSLLPIYTLVFLLATTYAIIRHHLFSLKIIATELTVLFLCLILLINVLSSNSPLSLLFNFFIFLGVAGIGILLIRGVINEVHRREDFAKLARKLRKANVKLKELDELKTEFMSIASHQLRTPLSVIKGYVALALEGAYGKLNRKITPVLKNTLQSDEHLIQLVDEFLNISRIEQGRIKFSFENTNIVSLIKDVIDELKIKASQKHLNISLEVTAKNINVISDHEKIRHVIYNFIDNAIKYTDQGKVSVITDDQKDGIVVRVIDTGVGFGEEDGINFFQKFYRGKNVRVVNVGGVGLGLYVARKFIEAHSGKIWAKSKGLGKGSEFGFWIPLVHKE